MTATNNNDLIAAANELISNYAEPDGEGGLYFPNPSLGWDALVAALESLDALEETT